mgnify:FL=1
MTEAASLVDVFWFLQGLYLLNSLLSCDLKAVRLRVCHLEEVPTFRFSILSVDSRFLIDIIH